jgi:hypothetical protein
VLICARYNQPQIIGTFGIEEVDPGCIEWLIRLNFELRFSSLDCSKITLPLNNLIRLAGVFWKNISYFFYSE